MIIHTYKVYILQGSIIIEIFICVVIIYHIWIKETFFFTTADYIEINWVLVLVICGKTERS